MNTITEPIKGNVKSLSKLGTKNPQWKGDNVGYKCLHRWIRRNKPMAERCETCLQVKRLEAANISQKYLRDLSDWKWLCRSCHMKEDGRYKNLKQYSGLRQDVKE